MTSNPESYFKYRPLWQWEGTTRMPHEFTASIFAKRELWYPAPSAFNDPFDCNIRLHTEGATDEEWAEYLDDLIRISPADAGNLSKAKIEKWWKTKPGLAESIGLDQHRKHYEESSVLCLARIGNSVQMFSYYADEHRGIALEFRFSDYDVICGIGFDEQNASGTPYKGAVAWRDVEYPPDYPELNFLKIRNSDKLLRGLLFTKHQGWSHEKEFRIFRRNVAPSAASFDASQLVRVILGCRCGNDEETLVRKWLAGWPTDVVLARARKSERAFDLKIDDIELIKGTATP